jgi:hypothetical protein
MKTDDDERVECPSRNPLGAGKKVVAVLKSARRVQKFGVKLLTELPERKFSFISFPFRITGRPSPCTATNYFSRLSKSKGIVLASAVLLHYGIPFSSNGFIKCEGELKP